MTIGERAKDIIANHLGVPRAKLVDSAHLADDLGIDDLERIELVMACEEEFKREIDDAAIETFHTVGDVVRFLEAGAT